MLPANPSPDGKGRDFEKYAPEERYRLLDRLVREGSTSSEFWISRVIQSLSFDQAHELLVHCLQNKEAGADAQNATQPDTREFMNRTLAARLAALDPRKAMERAAHLATTVEEDFLAQKLPRQPGLVDLVYQSSLVALVQQSGAEALRALKDSPHIIYDAFERSGIPENQIQVGGSFDEMKAALKNDVSALEGWNSFTVQKMLSSTLAKAYRTDPAGALQEIRGLVEQMQTNAQHRIHVFTCLSDLVVNDWRRSGSPEAASSLVEALRAEEKRWEENEKRPVELSSRFALDESQERIRKKGVDAGFDFAEAQENQGAQEAAATAVASKVLGTDVNAGLDWRRQLPEGPFKEGFDNALFSKLVAETNPSGPDWPSYERVLEAALRIVPEGPDRGEVLSKVAKRIADFLGETPTEFSSRLLSLPVSPAERSEILRSLAPIPSER